MNEFEEHFARKISNLAFDALVGLVYESEIDDSDQLPVIEKALELLNNRVNDHLTRIRIHLQNI